jgi:mutator protein MutT
MRPDSAIRVLAAVIERQGRILLTRRLAGTHLSGLWEFPGGKCEPNESDEACLARELAEELGVDAVVGRELLSVEHAYPDRRVRLHFRACTIVGQPRAVLGQEMRWVTRDELLTLQFPEADAELIRYLTQ